MDWSKRIEMSIAGFASSMNGYLAEDFARSCREHMNQTLATGKTFTEGEILTSIALYARRFRTQQVQEPAQAHQAEHVPFVDDQKIPSSIQFEWNNNPSVRAEFNDDLNTYAAYRKAEAAGRFRILGKQTNSFKR